MTRDDRYRVPAEDGGVAIVPPLEELVGLARSNAARQASQVFEVGGLSSVELARRARAEMLRVAGEFTGGLGGEVRLGSPDLIIATGHQPTLFHPGIWLKNHLAGRLARSVGAASVNFIVDNDTVDVSAIRVPVESEDGLAVREAPFIDCPAGVAAEEVRVPECACEALAEAARLGESALAGSLAAEFAGAVGPAETVAELVARPRRRLEEGFGLSNLELPVSRLCETEAFGIFRDHIVANAERFAAVHNAALERYRAAERISNAVDPVPNLGVQAGRLELPFWVWRSGGLRRPMFVGGESGAGRKVRPRALTMTLFFRLFCCDLFIHGMGGARYEPVNDGIIREFFGVEPPGYVAASGTLFVRPRRAVPGADTAALRQRLRRLQSTPEQFVDELLPGDADARELVRLRLALREPGEGTKRERRAAYEKAKKAGLKLQELLAPHILACRNELVRADRLESARAIAEDRTFPFFFYSCEALAGLYELSVPRTSVPQKPEQDPQP